MIRYLGIYLGTEEKVAQKWVEKVTEKMYTRFARWRERGLPRTRCGRNVVIRNSVLAVAWYMVQNQVPPTLDTIHTDHSCAVDIISIGAKRDIGFLRVPPKLRVPIDISQFADTYHIVDVVSCADLGVK